MLEKDPNLSRHPSGSMFRHSAWQRARARRVAILMVVLTTARVFAAGDAVGGDAPATALEAGQEGRPFGIAVQELLEKHPNIILSTAIATFMQSLLIAALLVHSRRRQVAEEQLRISEERYRTVIESQREMVCRYRENTTLTFVNDAYCRYFGRSREELLGKKFLSFVPESSHAGVLGAVQKMLETKRPISQEHQVILSDGKIAWMTWDDYPICNDSEEIEEFQCIGRDITVQREALEALRQSEERFSGVFRGSPTAISIIRQADGRLLDVNPSWEKMYEINRDQALGKTPVELGMFENRAAKKRFKSFLISAKPLLGFEQSTRTPTGGRRWMNISTELVLLGGEPCFIVMSKNITEQFEAEETRKSLARATRLALLGEFVASIAHEVNQPLGAILSNAETAEILLQLREPPLSEVRQILEDIRRDDLRASETINRVRSLITQGECRMVPLDINEVLLGVIRLTAHDVRRRGLSVVTQITPDLPPVAGDRIQIEQILLNLMLNAMDASAGTPMTRRTLTLSTVLKSDGWVEIGVADNGHGIPPEVLPRIFESFFSSKRNGMGLGLSLARSISEAHGGSITAENNTPCGATFRLVLPVHIEKPDP